MTLRYNAHVASGTFNTVTAGNAVSGNTLFIGGTYKKAGDVSAIVGLTAATSTITLAAKWQVSNDGSVWVDALNEPQNPASVVLVTGTAAAITKAVPAPQAVYSHKYARCQVVVGVATGAVGDLYSIGYSYRQLTGAQGS